MTVQAAAEGQPRPKRAPTADRLTTRIPGLRRGLADFADRYHQGLVLPQELSLYRLLGDLLRLSLGGQAFPEEFIGPEVEADLRDPEVRRALDERRRYGDAPEPRVPVRTLTATLAERRVERLLQSTERLVDGRRTRHPEEVAAWIPWVQGSGPFPTLPLPSGQIGRTIDDLRTEEVDQSVLGISFIRLVHNQSGDRSRLATFLLGGPGRRWLETDEARRWFQEGTGRRILDWWQDYPPFSLHSPRTLEGVHLVETLVARFRSAATLGGSR
jgi:hypothetical protein